MKGVWVLPFVLIVGACDSSPTDPDAECRRYMSSLVENGTSFTCSFDRGSATLQCTSSPFQHRIWEYAGVDEFVAEVSVPNRTLADARTSQSGGTLGSFATTRTEYRYDDRGRLQEHVRTGESSAVDLDFVQYTSWDALDRPTGGVFTANGGSETITIRYDDSIRRMEASNGESMFQDANGNPVREVFVFGIGSSQFRVERDYQILTVGEICR